MVYAIGRIHEEFIGKPMNFEEASRFEFFKMKHYFYQRKDLKRLYQQMSKRFHILHGIDDPNLKQACITSFPEDLASETIILIKLRGLQITHLTLGETITS